MTHALIAAKSGWGKSWTAQYWLEDNYGSYPLLVVLDRRDEFRGLAKAGVANWGIVGDEEAQLSPAAWRGFIQGNQRVVLTNAVDTQTWRDAAAAIAEAAMSLDQDVLLLIDEAHKVAPQKEGYPDAIETLATEGRGRLASVWVTQRLAKLDETPIGEMMVYILGGFQSDADLRKVRGNIGYPADVHKVNQGRIPGLPEELHAPDEGSVALRKFKEHGRTVGSEWVYSDDDGRLRRINTRDLEMASTHYGPQSLDLSVPG